MIFIKNIHPDLNLQLFVSKLIIAQRRRRGVNGKTSVLP